CDHRGLGRSEGLRGHVSDFGTYARDLAAFVEHIGGTDLPQVVYGHSMGGLIAIEYVAEHAEGLAGVVLSAPGIRLFRPPSRWTLRFGRFFAAFLPLLPMPPGIDPEGISSDPAVAVASKKDRMMTKRVSLRWMLEFVGAQGRVEGFARRIELPTLILQGTADGVIEPAGAADLAEWIPAEDVTLRTFPDGRHELHNEVPALRIPAMDAVAEWFDARWNGA
ncbi:MAG: lysophospholipase, partial [Planctomycetota bacterium]